MDIRFSGGYVTLLSSANTGAGSAFDTSGINTAKTFQGVVSGTGAVTATINIEVSNDGINWLVLGTVSLSGTTSASDGFAANAAWARTRANITAISGTGAVAVATMGV